MSRRDFLRIGGIAGAGAVLAACDRGGSPQPSTSRQPSNPRGDGRDLPSVAIVGAGLAG
ncbi:MAG: twin-arginine translocation signal domain-containing protein [Actinomycetota bacterium]